jgi:fused signal recognition particle receptor
MSLQELGDNDLFMWLAGISTALLFTALFFYIARAGLKAFRESESSLPPELADSSPTQAPASAAVSLSTALAKTRSSFLERLKSAFSKSDTLSIHELEDIEEALYTSDLGPQTVGRLLEAVTARMKSEGQSGFEAVRGALKNEMLQIFEKQAKPVALGTVEGLEQLNIGSQTPAVILIVGVNGAGKTTTIGKLASRLAQSGRKVLVAAGDTFRAAAGEQLRQWTERAHVEIFQATHTQDPSAVAFDACQLAQAKGFDVVIIDTAGRLHTQKNLMEELRKMKRVIDKQIPGAPHEVLLVLDANSGQNALLQAREFQQALDVTGVVLTKLDGTAKGGVAVGLAFELGLPIKLIGVGEGLADLRKFSSEEFVNSIL